MRILVFILFLSLPYTILSQNDTVRIDYLHLFEKRNPELDNYLQMDDKTNTKLDVSLPDYRPIKKTTQTYTLELPPMNTYQEPAIDYRLSNLRLPHANDYAFRAMYHINRNAYLTTFSSQTSQIGIGQTQTINTRMAYQVTDWFNISAGPYASKYAIYDNLYSDFGVGSKAQLVLSDRFRINGYGQYSGLSQSNSIPPHLWSMYPSSHYGGTLEVKITDTFGVEGGMMREFSAVTGKWENKPVFAPVFYQKKAKKKKQNNDETF